MGMEFVEKKILNNRTIDMVEHAVLMMCSYIPFGSWADQCEEFGETYGDQIVHLIVDTELTPQVKPECPPPQIRIWLFYWGKKTRTSYHSAFR